MTRFGIVAMLGAIGCSSPSNNEKVCQQSAALRTCAGTQVVQGVDVSKYDATVNWTQVKAAGVQFGFARISDGVANPDAYFVANWQGMRGNGILRGAYQYFRASADPTAQANLIVSSLQKAGGLQAGDLPVVMDLETADGQTETTVAANMKVWLAQVASQTGLTPIIYTSAGTYPVTTAAFAAYPLWVANYGATCPSMPVGWSQWRFWQYSSTGSVTGIGTGNVDRDEFDGTLADLMAFAASAGSDAGMAGPKDGGGPPFDAGPPSDSGPWWDGGHGETDAGGTDDGGASANGGSAMGNAGNGSASADASTSPCR